jgi:hypothetical protein
MVTMTACMREALVTGSSTTEEVIVRGAIEFITGHSLNLTEEQADTLVTMLKPLATPWAENGHDDPPTHLDHATAFLQVDDPAQALYALIEYMGMAGLWTAEEALQRATYESEGINACRRDLGEDVDPDDDPAIDLDIIPWKGVHPDDLE